MDVLENLLIHFAPIELAFNDLQYLKRYDFSSFGIFAMPTLLNHAYSRQVRMSQATIVNAKEEFLDNKPL